MQYSFKINEEFLWFVAVAAGTVILQALATMDVDKIVDWRVWAIALAVAAIRAGAGAALSYAARPAPPASRTLTDEALKQVVDAIEQRMKETPAP